MAGDPTRLIRALANAIVAFGVTAGMGLLLRVPTDVAFLQASAVAVALVVGTFAVASMGY
ncbi:hypothetical protein [Haloarchaeobius sp. FL176]|uniref:hypothetical protein n=1 Tax=Haloarchaeobius sp. FL176 TaxID=2967129 RepID=UPI00214823AE|nr:hypothetical protein [Haloarchaeobius sp. FL176]